MQAPVGPVAAIKRYDTSGMIRQRVTFRRTIPASVSNAFSHHPARFPAAQNTCPGTNLVEWHIIIIIATDKHDRAQEYGGLLSFGTAQGALNAGNTVKGAENSYSFSSSRTLPSSTRRAIAPTVSVGAERIVPVLERLGRAEDHPTVAVVSHGAALGIALATLLDANPRAWRNYHVENCSITELRFVPHAEVGVFNHTTHL